MEFLPYFLNSAEGDMTKAIQDRLDKYNACFLGAGRFEVKGIVMPDNSTLCGLGAASRLVLSPEVEDGAAVKLGSYCTVKDLRILGADEPIELPEAPGKRHGVLFWGDATPKNVEGVDQPKHCNLSGLMISAFNGGAITCHGTGYAVRCCVNAINCHLTNCGVGIYIPYFSEYHRFSNILSTDNLYGCINNGGNNTFVGCGFDSNGTGFVIDNGDNKACNNSHGTVVGCTFNHSGNNKGIGIHLINANIGEVFSGGQMWFSKIVVENSDNIAFDSFNFGRDNKFIIKGKNPVFINNCHFYTEPEFITEDGGKVIITNCYLKDGTAIEG